MSVTNTIRDNVNYVDEMEEWFEEALSNDEIIEKLDKEKSKAFLSFSWGVYVTAIARNNLLRRVVELDDYACYMDTDSIKLVPGYDKNVFIRYNKTVRNRIEYVAKQLRIDVSCYEPEDKYGVKHLLGVFESETEGDNPYTYEEFITQGAKKYAVRQNGKIKITVAGVPKAGAKELKKLDDFRDDLVFHFENTNKNLLAYVDKQEKCILEDYQGHISEITDKSGCCLVPTTYVLGKSEEYVELISDASSKRSRYKE